MVLVIEPQLKYLLRLNMIIHRGSGSGQNLTQSLHDSPVGTGLSVLNIMDIVIGSECLFYPQRSPDPRFGLQNVAVISISNSQVM